MECECWALSLEKSGGQEEGCEMDVTGETAGVVYKKKFSISCFSVKLYNVHTLEEWRRKWAHNERLLFGRF